jgi:hypothetical protein
MFDGLTLSLRFIMTIPRERVPSNGSIFDVSVIDFCQLCDFQQIICDLRSEEASFQSESFLIFITSLKQLQNPNLRIH